MFPHGETCTHIANVNMCVEGCKAERAPHRLRRILAILHPQHGRVYQYHPYPPFKTETSLSLSAYDACDPEHLRASQTCCCLELPAARAGRRFTTTATASPLMTFTTFEFASMSATLHSSTNRGRRCTEELRRERVADMTGYVGTPAA